MPEPFSAFMARALFDPARGYYTRHIRTVGARGDFSTAATLSPLLGQAIAAWLREESALQPSVRHVIEIGAGSGALMAVVRQALGWWTRRIFHWHIVETSPVLRAQQQEMLGRRVVWHDDMAAALAASGGRALIYHNELLDAFPVTLAQWQAGAWHEVHVERDTAGHVRESLKPLPMPAEERADFSALQHPFIQPQRCELHLSVHDWLRAWSPHWRQGAMLTVDYGDVFPALYHRRPRGTLRAYLLQQRLEGAAVYENPGRQDITADVNFTDYRAWAATLGWQEAMYGTLAEFVTRRLPCSKDDRLLDAEGAGGAFKHVIHRRLATC